MKSAMKTETGNKVTRQDNVDHDNDSTPDYNVGTTEGKDTDSSSTELAPSSGICTTSQNADEAAALVAAVLVGGCNSAKTPKEETEEERKLRHIMANRKSAKKSRERQKQKVEKLSVAADTLLANNRSLKKVNSQLSSCVQHMKDQLRRTTTALQQRDRATTGAMVAREMFYPPFFGIPIQPAAPDANQQGQYWHSPRQTMMDSNALIETEKPKNNFPPSTADGGFETFALGDPMIEDLKSASAPVWNAGGPQDQTNMYSPSPSFITAVDSTPHHGRIIAAPPLANASVQEEPEETEAEKKLQRVMRNRKSAKDSRIRRRETIAKLTGKIDMLTAGNHWFQKTNSTLLHSIRGTRKQLKEALDTIQQQQREEGRIMTLQEQEVIDAVLSNLAADADRHDHEDDDASKQQQQQSSPSPCLSQESDPLQDEVVKKKGDSLHDEAVNQDAFDKDSAQA